MKPSLHLVFVALVTTCLATGNAQCGELHLPSGSSVYSNGSLVPVSELKQGDIIYSVDGKKLRVTSAKDIEAASHVSCLGVQTTGRNQMAYIVGPGVAVLAAHESTRTQTNVSVGDDPYGSPTAFKHFFHALQSSVLRLFGHHSALGMSQ